MHRILLTLCVLLCGLLPAQAKPTSVDKAFDTWLKAYRKAGYDLGSHEDVSKTSVLAPFGLLKGVTGAITHRKEIEILLDKAVEEDSGAAAQRVLRAAATGLDPFAYTLKMAPHIVRALGEQAITRFKSNEAKDAVLQHARERKDQDEGKEFSIAVQAAALRALGSFGDATFRTSIEEQLNAADERLRLAAADALAHIAATASLEPLARLLEKETKDPVLQGLASALTANFEKNDKEQKPESARVALLAAISALGRGTWRSDIALVEFLSRFRARESVPALISVLERFAASIEDVKSGKLSTLLRWRAHETLLVLTGAFFPADKPDQWRAFWEKQKDTFQLAPAKEPLTTKDKFATVTKSFFGIPVQGSRVMFVVDCSGSMIAPMKGGGTTATGEVADKIQTRLDAAKENLTQSIQQLPEESKVNLVWFSFKVHLWNEKELLPATAANKKRLLDFVQGLKADGGTNLWGGLQEALKMKSLVYGAHYESNIDELFIISDGLPSVGDIIDPDELLKLVTDSNRFSRVRINTVYLGELKNDRDKGEDGGPLMKKLAEQNGGKFVRK